MKSALSCPAKLPLPGTVLHRGQREVKSPECTGKKAGEGCLKRPGPVLSHLLNTYMDTHTCTHTHTHTHTCTHTHTGMLLCVNTHCSISSLQWGFLRRSERC